MMNILVTGGIGYIGSHTVVELINKGHHVIIVDNLSNSNIKTLNIIENLTNKKVPFYQKDVTDKQALLNIFNNNKIDGVIHFAGLKAVGESVEKPLMYYQNNLMATITLTEVCSEYDVKKIVFSSSATVYGNQTSPMNETMKLLQTTNPYGETKAMSERIFQDIAKADPQFSIVLLRYFNPVGAHSSGLLGENPSGTPNNLVPYMTKVAKGKLDRLFIYGNDYDTVDGTGIRDYIHVVDLAKGHVAAIENLTKGLDIYNLGTGKGTSVLEMIDTFEKVNQIKIPYEIVERRPGDIATCYADVTKAEKELAWQAKLSVGEMLKDAWRYESNI
ncbi:UDP-galactose 4-epimerase [Pelagirhabdus alkalitolerans]|uniref:UDP-glucose 4-epimerase n=2 Tax=Pelagirhabdus alkalitolerans TaxID=1612202 RepID=A0A1G6GHD5_9BACI|nr:UDP-galactose 4-epimerase [Pelagirhabdus alkalitolerans]